MNMRSVLRIARAHARGRMSARVLIERPTGAKTTDPGTGIVTAVYTTLHDEYPVRFKSYEPFEQVDNVAGLRATDQRTGAHFPASAEYVPAPGDRLTVISEAVDDSWVGRVFLVASKPQTAQATAYRVFVDERTSS